MDLRISSEWRHEPDAATAGASELPEDAATLGEIAIAVGRETLTRALDRTLTERDGANLSAYRLAEWLVWNWWRLRWEPGHRGGERKGWRNAHDLAGIGGGWLWPNITVHTDGVHVTLVAKRSHMTRAEPLSYTVDHAVETSTRAFEAGVDDFAHRVLRRLEDRSLDHTDLHTMWRELVREREDPELSLYRKFEAFLGADPDEADPEAIRRLLEESGEFGMDAMAEVAADCPLTVQQLGEVARDAGFDVHTGDAATAPAAFDHRLPAWKVGVNAARRLRKQERLGLDPVPDHRLAELFGVGERALDESSSRPSMAFALHDNDGGGRLVLRSQWPAGRRFELARLLADGLLVQGGERLHPATRAYTYRQKMQRAFAGEFLCPIDGLAPFLDHDFSDEALDEAANHFRVSPLTVRTLLANNRHMDHGAIPR